MCKLISMHIIIRKTSSFFIIVFTILIITNSILYIAGCSVVSDLYEALKEIEYLEETGLLTNPPDDISCVTRREIETCGSSSVLREDIKSHEILLAEVEAIFPLYIILLILAIVVRVFYRYKISGRRIK